MINAHRVQRLRILHAIHDFLPRHPAGSELYAYDLASAQAASHDVWVLAAEYEPTVPHGALRWRAYEQIPVIELINNWAFRTFDDTYGSPRLNRQIAHVLHAIQPDIVHVHNLLNLSFELPRLARERGARAVATLHDYTLVCAAGGQRVHTADAHLCETIDPERCARCFAESPLGSQFAAGRTLGGGTVFKAAAHFYRRAPSAMRFLARTVGGSPSVTSEDLRRRLAASWSVFDMLDAVVAPSQSMATEYIRLGVSPRRLEVSSYGSTVAVHPPRARASSVPNIGFVGTLIWHKGPHVLLQAARMLRGSFTITLYGDPAVAPDYFEDLQRQAHGLPVTFAGPFERTGLAAVYKSLDLAVVPSLWLENAPFVIQEALAYRVPVVGSAIGGIPEFVQPGVNGALFECGSPASLAEALQRLIDDPAERVRLGSSPVSIKSIAQDAAEWDVRYERVLTRSSLAAVPVTCQP